VGIQDHPYQHHFFDTWSLIPTLIAETKRVSFFTDVASLPLRPPAVMAKAAASLDVLSGGRFELGLGGGALPELISNPLASDFATEVLSFFNLILGGFRGPEPGGCDDGERQAQSVGS
jgi:hypothetical protein